MTSPGRGDLGGLEGEAFDFSQLEEYINDDSESNIYFHDALVTSSDLRVEKPHYAPPSRKEHQHHLPAEATTDARGQTPAGHACAEQQQKVGFGAREISSSSSSFNKPHHLPDSPPDSGSEPPFSPPNEDPKLRCPSIELLTHHHHHHHPHRHHLASADMSSVHAQDGDNPYMGFAVPPKHVPDSSSATSPTSTSSSSPHHQQQQQQHGGTRHHSPVPASPVPVHSTHSASMPVLASPLGGQLIAQIPPAILSPYVTSPLQPQLITASGSHLNHLYAGSEDFLYDNLSSPVTSTTTGSKKRKLPESPKHRNPHTGVHVKTEPKSADISHLGAPSPDPSTTVLPSSEDDYSFDLSAAEASALFVDSSYQCIRFQPFQQNTWAQLYYR